MKRALISLLVLVTTFTMLAVPVSAAVPENDLVMPCYEHVQSHEFNFYVTSAGQLCVVVNYRGTPSTFTQAKITVEIEKRFLGIFWTTVEIGYPDDLWIEYSTDVNGTFTKTFASDGTGTYRATIKLEISGMYGADDVIEKEIQCEYN